jgi:hypothetical protein
MEKDHLGDPGTDGKIIIKRAAGIHLSQDIVEWWTSVGKTQI